jgi:chemotaxis protein MotA
MLARTNRDAHDKRPPIVTRRPRRRLDYAGTFGVPAALAIVLLAQIFEGAPVRALWQPTAALVVFGGTLAAVLVSYPFATVRRTLAAARGVFVDRAEPMEGVVDRVVRYAQIARRKGAIALEAELDRTGDPFLHAALALAVDGAKPPVVRQILEVESAARRERDEAPADVLETAAGYAPTLGILGAVLGLIHVMQSLGEPSTLGSGIAVAFVATVYGVGSANLVLLPIATRLRTAARQSALARELVIEGIADIQEGLSPRFIEQKLRGFLLVERGPDVSRRVA